MLPFKLRVVVVEVKHLKCALDTGHSTYLFIPSFKQRLCATFRTSFLLVGKKCHDAAEMFSQLRSITAFAGRMLQVKYISKCKDGLSSFHKSSVPDYLSGNEGPCSSQIFGAVCIRHLRLDDFEVRSAQNGIQCLNRILRRRTAVISFHH